MNIARNFFYLTPFGRRDIRFTRSFFISMTSLVFSQTDGMSPPLIPRRFVLSDRVCSWTILLYSVFRRVANFEIVLILVATTYFYSFVLFAPRRKRSSVRGRHYANNTFIVPGDHTTVIYIHISIQEFFF